MTFLNKLLGILSAIGAVISAVFFVLFKQSKNEKEQAIKEKEQAERTAEENSVAAEKIIEAEKARNEVLKSNEELIEKAHSGNKLSNCAAVDTILSK